MSPLWSYGLAAIGILGILLAGQKRSIGWAIGLGAQVLWILYAYATNQPGFYLSAIAYGIVYARNWWKWTREPIAPREYVAFRERTNAERVHAHHVTDGLRSPGCALCTAYPPEMDADMRRVVDAAWRDGEAMFERDDAGELHRVDVPPARPGPGPMDPPRPPLDRPVS